MQKNINYSDDFFGWTHEQIQLLKCKDYQNMDVIHLMQEIESLGNSERSKLESHLIILLMHLLKMKFQPERQTRSWGLSVINARFHANRTLKKNPSLKHHLDEILFEAYFSARLAASQETGLETDIFPEECPWNISEILEENNV
jgi:hypothetical protein